MIRTLFLVLIAGFMAAAPQFALAQNTPLRIEVTEGVIEPMPFAAPQFIAENAEAQGLAQQVTEVIISDLAGSGLFREIPASAHISKVENFDAPIQFADWKALNAQALITGAAQLTSDNRLVLKFRLFDVFAQTPLEGLQFAASAPSWRRMAHKVADVIYARLTGETGYFDSRVVYIAEEGPKNARVKRLAIMDYDGANNRYLTDGKDIVLAPRFSPNAREIVYTSYETGAPSVFLMNVDSLERRSLGDQEGMTFAPRFSPDGSKVVMSLSTQGNTDIYSMDVATGQHRHAR